MKNRLSKEEILRILQSIYWERNVNPERLYKILKGDVRTSGAEKYNLYLRLITGCDWYTLRKIFSDRELMQLLADDVLQRIYPKEMKEKFLYARRLLSESNLSATG